MKKKLVLMLLPLLGLVSCTSNRSSMMSGARLDVENGLPTIHIRDSEHTTYLMLSPFGEIQNYEGISTKGDVADKFYENTVVLKAEPGTALPNASQVKTSVAGAVFRGWVWYNPDNDNVWPEYFETVPQTNGLALKALFDGTNASSGGESGGGSGGGQTGENVTYSVINFPNWIPNDGSTVFAWGWGPGNDGTWYKISLSMDGTDGSYTNVTGTFVAPNNLSGFNMARCVAGTQTPNWKAVGDADGRVYNKTGDVTCTAGTYTYSSPTWVEYAYVA